MSAVRRQSAIATTHPADPTNDRAVSGRSVGECRSVAIIGGTLGGMTAMTKRERIEAALARKPVDRPPVAFWRHVPDVDHIPAQPAAARTATASTLILNRRIRVPVPLCRADDSSEA